jgi:cobyric acid synthase
MSASLVLTLSFLTVDTNIDKRGKTTTHETIAYTITKTTIGEFIIHDGRIYSVYEMERNIRGEMVAK